MNRISSRLGIVGPIAIAPFSDYLYAEFSTQRSLPNGLGGSPVVNLCLELLKRKYSLIIITLDPYVSNEVILEGPNLKICVGPYRPSKRARDFFRLERKYLYETICREGPDLIHAHWTYEFAWAAIDSGIPCVITAHDAPYNILRFDHSPYRIIRTIMASRVLRKTKNLTAVSPFIAEHLNKNFGYSKEIQVIPNGLHNQIIEMPQHSGYMKAWKEITFAFVGNWSKLKNPQTAILAFNKVKNVIPKARLIMFGPGMGKGEAAENWALQSGLSVGILFLGAIPYATLLQTMDTEVDVLVHPSFEESFGMALIEAMALGIPVIGGDSSGAVPWVLDYGRAGVLCNVSSVESLTEAMVRLSRDNYLYQTISDTARMSVQSRFSISHVADMYTAIYNRI